MEPPLNAARPGYKGGIWAEIAIVMGLSLGASAVYSVISLIDVATRPKPLASQSTTLNRSLSERPAFDFVYQILSVFFDLVPVALVAYLLWSSTRPHLSRLGVDLDRPGRDTASGLLLALIVGVPGIALYLAGRALGLAVNVIPTALDTYWWTVPVLILAALRAGITEEVIAIGYLFTRLRDLGWGRWQIILTSAVFRGTYHLYQGPAAFVGNFAMGVLFGWLYTRTSRLMPLVIAHTLIDVAVFVGYPFVAAAFPVLFP